MSPSNNLLICGLLQVTLVALAGLLTLPVFRRLRRNATVVLKHTLLGIGVLTVAAFLPLPSWLSMNEQDVPAEIPVVAHEMSADTSGPKFSVPKTAPQPFGLREYLAAGLDGLRTMNAPAPVLSAPTETKSAAENLPSFREHWFLWLLGGGIVLGLLRLAGGLWGVHCLIQSSRPQRDMALSEIVDLLAAEMRCTAKIEVRESNQIATAATVGWRKPVILLSAQWRTWTDEQRRSVLAHEIAHIARGDFATSLIAQVGLILHFYHPLVHWLVQQLRLEQELAADAVAAQVVGGSRVYLCSIGELALTNTREHVSWPAHAFLPTRRTFLRRIEMLRDLKLFSGQTSRGVRTASLLAVLGVTASVAGLRPPESLAQNPPAKKAALAGLGPGETRAVAKAMASVSHVPEDAVVVATVNVADIAPLYDLARKTMNDSKEGGIPPAEPAELKFAELMRKCRQVTLVICSIDRGTPDPVAMKLEFVDSTSRDTAIAELKRGRTFEAGTWDNVAVEVADPLACARVGESTVLFGHAPTVRKMLKAGDASLSTLTQSAPWKAVEQGTIALAVDATRLKQVMAGAPQDPATAMLSPLWSQASSYTLGINLKDDLSLALQTESPDEKSAKMLENSLNGGLALINGLLANAQVQLPEDSSDKKVMEVLSTMLSSQQFERKGTSVTLKLEVEKGTTENLITETFVPAIIRARMAAQRSLQANNMKQIMLALHNYASAYGHLPPAVVIDKESGVARSWRIEILPYIEQAPLYEAYRKNEPWDSEANKAVLAKMPSVFRHPSQPADSTFSSIFLAYGEGLFAEPGDKEGLDFADVTDGTSTTIALVEARQEIPWTKPEDVKIDVKADKLPQFGFVPEGWHVGMGDGSVRFLSRTIDVNLLKAMLTRAGGEVLP
ncbi:MAG: DUF1559 domain-containing protein [Planctomycetaceae bacterium]|nr:DUF1559 domain-containing protein [Planctomycetaceae bacterium]